MHSWKSAISLSWMVCAFPPGLALNRSGQELGPTQPSLRSLTAIKIPFIRTPSPAGRGMPNHYSGDLLLTIAMSGLSRVRTELLLMAVVATLAPHPVQVHRQFPRHRYFRNRPSTPHGQVKELAAPLRLTAHRDLRRFHQQKPQQHVALLADVPESMTISTGLLRRNQPDVAGQLLPAMKALRSSDHQLVGKRRQRADSGMRHQQSRDWALVYFLFQCPSQFLDLRSQLIEQVEQVLPPSAGPRHQHDGLQLLATRRPPQRLLAAQAFVECHHMQLVHHSRAHLHQTMPMPQQLPQIAIGGVGYPDSGKAVLHHQP